jgi:hypothetical protein
MHMTARVLSAGFLSCAIACGGGSAEQAGDGGAEASSGAQGSSGADAGGADAGQGADAGGMAQQGRGDAGSDAGAYVGFLVASMTSFQGQSASHTLYAGFQSASAGAPLRVPGTPPSCAADGLTHGACCEEPERIGLPASTVPPVAGNLTITDHGASVATLVSPDYPEVDSATWAPGDSLAVSAAGGDVLAFSGTLVTPVAIAGVSPDFTQSSVAIAHDADLHVSWTPESKEGEVMQLQIDSIENGAGHVVLCAVPDSAGSIVVDASLLAPLFPSSSGGIQLTRSITSSPSAPNAIVTFDGNYWLDSAATIQ